METERCCYNCKYHEFEDIDNGWVCVNDESEFVADWTEPTFGCPEWEERDGEEENV